MTEDARSFVTQALIVAGLIMTVLCGGCSTWYGLALLDSYLRGDTYLISVAIMGWILIGLIPTAMGVLLLWVGLRRRAKDPS